MTSIPREFLGAEKTRLGRQHWYHMFGPVLANYATVANLAEAPNKNCSLRGVSVTHHVLEVSAQ